MCLIFILLSSNEIFAYEQNNSQNVSFEKLKEKIKADKICEIKYNPSKTAAIVNINCGSAYYINFKTQQIYAIIANSPNVFPTWISDTIAHIESPCGTGCSKSVIFIAPAIIVSCPMHEYRIKNLSQDEPPDYYNNTPLLIDSKKKLYVCYDEDNNIQVLPLPGHASIRPPKGYFSERAEIKDDQLVIIYRNKKGKINRVSYGKI